MAIRKYRNSKAKPLELPSFDNVSQMATMTKIPVSVLREAIKAGCPMTKHGRPDLLTFIEWYFNRALSDDETENWNNRDKRASALIREEKLRRLKKESINFSEVDFFLGELVNNIFFGELDRLCQEFPPALKGRNEIEIKDECERQKGKVKQSLTSRLNAWKDAAAKDEAPNE